MISERRLDVLPENGLVEFPKTNLKESEDAFADDVVEDLSPAPTQQGPVEPNLKFFGYIQPTPLHNLKEVVESQFHGVRESSRKRTAQKVLALVRTMGILRHRNSSVHLKHCRIRVPNHVQGRR